MILAIIIVIIILIVIYFKTSNNFVIGKFKDNNVIVFGVKGSGKDISVSYKKA